MKHNKHSQHIPAEILEQARTKINDAVDLLKPYLIALTPAEKQEIPKVGPKTLNFVEKSHEYAHENPELVPHYLNMDEFDTDFAGEGMFHLKEGSFLLRDGNSYLRGSTIILGQV